MDFLPKKRVFEVESTITGEYQYDIGRFLSRTLSDGVKHELLTKCWVPDDAFKFPQGQRNLKFQKKWIHDFQWLSYSENQNGAFCKRCLLFAKDFEVGKGHHIKLGAFVLSPFNKWKDSKEEFRRHESSNYTIIVAS